MRKIFLIVSVLVGVGLAVDVKETKTTPVKTYTTFNERVGDIAGAAYETFYNNSVLPVSGHLQIPATFKGQMLGSSKFTSYNNSSSDTLEFLGGDWKFCDGCFGDSLVVIGIKGEVRPEWWGSGANAINRAIQASNKVLLTDTLYSVSSQIVLKSNMVLRGIGYNTVKIKEIDSFSLTATQNAMVYGTNLTNVIIDGIHFQGDAGAYRGDGVDRHALKLRKSNNCIIKNCRFSKTEKGFSYYDSCYNSKIEKCIVDSCYYSGISSYGHSAGSLQNKYITISNCSAFLNVGASRVDDTIASPEGFRFEETYFSNINNCESNKNGTGFRIENSCNNSINGNTAFQNRKYGLSLYNLSKRNTITGCQIIDNVIWASDTGWDDSISYVAADTSVKSRGNKWTATSGLILEASCHNNTISGNVIYNSTSGIGKQLYGIVLNQRNFPDSTNADCDNVIYGNTCINNVLSQIRDNGRYNRVYGNVTRLRGE